MADGIEVDEKLRKVFKFVESQTKILMDKYEIEGVSEEEMEKLLSSHMEQWYSFTEDGHLKSANIPIKFQFDESFEWVNAKSPRGDLNELAASNLIIFDFFTHCCIDCIHSIEDLRQVYHQIKSIRDNTNDDFNCGYKIISIHSPKFTTEKKSDSIQSSVQRMKMEHTEVLNDPYQILWKQFGLVCWPTIMIFGPNLNPEQPGPNLMFAFTLDNHRDFLKLVSRVSLEFFDARITSKMVENFKDGLANEELTVKVASNDFRDSLKSNSFLNFPGKVTVYGDLVCISDTGNNRIVVANVKGEIQDVIGGTDDGFQDGHFGAARFYGPQGVAFESATIFYVADTGNHSIRKVDLSEKVVSTIVPPGDPVLNLKSPWDLTFYNSEVLLIAGARTHQIFGYFFAETELFGRKHSQNEVALVAGTGFEENRNHSDPLEASFSQPSGLVCTGDGDTRTVYIADSESSSIRRISGGNVLPVVGASTDLYNLFAFGDQDGIGFDAKLQHPMAVAAAGETTLYLTDTYNHKIKEINLQTKECKTLIGNGSPGNQLGSFDAQESESDPKTGNFALLNEPAGMCIDATGKYLFIADTNNHSIKVAHLDEKIVSEFLLKPLDSGPLQQNKFFQVFDKAVPNSKYVSITININNLPETFEGGNWKLFIPIYGAKSVASGRHTVDTTGESVVIETQLPFVPWLRETTVTLTMAFCTDSGCHLREFELLVNFTGAATSDSGIVLNFTPEKEAFE